MVGEKETQGEVRRKSTLSTAIANWSFPSIDFSKPVQSRALLKAVNFLCKIFGKRLPIRFFSYDSTTFDASVLTHLPDVQWLKVDCLQAISNSERIFELSKLKKFSFGVYNYDNPNFLHQLNLSKLEQLSISETKKRNFDLSPLCKGKQIRSLFVEGHTKNIEAVGELKNLETLRLWSIDQKTSLEFVSNISKLNSLEVVLGGRQNIDEISLPFLRSMRIVMVRGFNTLGDLSRFPRLKILRIENQIKLQSITFQTSGLTKLSVINCKSLKALIGLEYLQKIKRVHFAQTSLDYEALSEFSWSKSLKVLSLYSGKEKRDIALRMRLKSKGYKFDW
jgi:hypothetical protein